MGTQCSKSTATVLFDIHTLPSHKTLTEMFSKDPLAVVISFEKILEQIIKDAETDCLGKGLKRRIKIVFFDDLTKAKRWIRKGKLQANQEKVMRTLERAYEFSIDMRCCCASETDLNAGKANSEVLTFLSKHLSSSNRSKDLLILQEIGEKMTSNPTGFLFHLADHIEKAKKFNETIEGPAEKAIMKTLSRALVEYVDILKELEPTSSTYQDELIRLSRSVFVLYKTMHRLPMFYHPKFREIEIWFFPFHRLPDPYVMVLSTYSNPIQTFHHMGKLLREQVGNGYLKSQNLEDYQSKRMTLLEAMDRLDLSISGKWTEIDVESQTQVFQLIADVYYLLSVFHINAKVVFYSSPGPQLFFHQKVLLEPLAMEWLLQEHPMEVFDIFDEFCKNCGNRYLRKRRMECRVLLEQKPWEERNDKERGEICLFVREVCEYIRDVQRERREKEQLEAEAKEQENSKKTEDPTMPTEQKLKRRADSPMPRMWRDASPESSSSSGSEVDDQDQSQADPNQESEPKADKSNPKKSRFAVKTDPSEDHIEVRADSGKPKVAETPEDLSTVAGNSNSVKTENEAVPVSMTGTKPHKNKPKSPKPKTGLPSDHDLVVESKSSTSKSEAPPPTSKDPPCSNCSELQALLKQERYNKMLVDGELKTFKFKVDNYDKMEKEAKKLRTEKNKMEKEIRKMKRTIETLSCQADENKKLREENEKQKNEIERLKSSNDRITKSHGRLEIEYESVLKEKREKDEDLRKTNEIMKDLLKEKQALLEENQQLNGPLSSGKVSVEKKLQWHQKLQKEFNPTEVVDRIRNMAEVLEKKTPEFQVLMEKEEKRLKFAATLYSRTLQYNLQLLEDTNSNIGLLPVPRAPEVSTRFKTKFNEKFKRQYPEKEEKDAICATCYEEITDGQKIYECKGFYTHIWCVKCGEEWKKKGDGLCTFRCGRKIVPAVWKDVKEQDSKK